MVKTNLNYTLQECWFFWDLRILAAFYWKRANSAKLKMYTRRYKILWEEKKMSLIIYIFSWFIIQKYWQYSWQRKDGLFACTVLHILLFYLVIWCIASAISIFQCGIWKTFWIVSKISTNTFLAYIYASPWNSQILRHRVTGLIFR